MKANLKEGTGSQSDNGRRKAMKLATLVDVFDP